MRSRGSQQVLTVGIRLAVQARALDLVRMMHDSFIPARSAGLVRDFPVCDRSPRLE